MRRPSLKTHHCLVLLAFPASLDLSAKVDFSEEVRPILNAHCTACHGGVKEAGDVSFIYREKALGKGDSGKPVIVPGDPDASEMMARILSSDPDEVMPKPEHGPPLPQAEIDTLRQWITEGAEWGEHWSFTPPKIHPAPDVQQTDWPRNDIDRFVLAKLEANQLAPSGPADRAALLRRASLDLIGLPPTINELDAFLINPSEEAYEAEIDRLLASPRFGERWASVWMDLARYADSEGLGIDGRRTIWKYRDWLIDAFNRDQPFDQFTIDQLAGDLIPDATLEQKIATAFHRLTQANNEGGTDDEEFRVAAVIDRVNTTWEVWQGVSFGCVQCHSHPYDPIEFNEFYEFTEFFNQTRDADLAEHSPLLRVPVDSKRNSEVNQLNEQIRSAEKELHATRTAIDSRTTWHWPSGMQAVGDKTKLEVKKHDGIEEYRTVGNVTKDSTFELTFPTPDPLTTLTALRVEFWPTDPETAIHTPEWGADLKKIWMEVIDADGVSQKPLAAVIADEAHPLFNPNASLTGKGRGWGTYSKTFGPRHAIVLPKEPIALPEGSSIRVHLRQGGAILASFPMVSERGRIAVTDSVEWADHLADTEVVSLQRQIEEARNQLKRIPTTTVPVMEERDPAFARSTRQFIRGNWLDKGEAVEMAGTPRVFPPLNPRSDKPDRLDLARWIASAENPLTARVAVNRFWLELFGTGIVPTPEDFGSAGEKPTHPELLDTLAVRFSSDMRWSVKTLLREIVLSATYRQDASVTPELAKLDAGNRFLARGPRQRLTAEMVRDHALAAGGLIQHRSGGAPTHPPIPPGVWTPFQGNDKWDTPKEGAPDRYRRAVYTYWKRSIPYPSFMTFDAPTREMCNKRRLVSNTPLQALTVLNDPAFNECAKGLARVMKYGTEGDIDAKLAAGYRQATSRTITPDRLSELRSLYNRLESEYKADPATMAMMAGTPDGAAFTVVGSVILNLDEALTR
ncbi:PSD1 and planctomycete cytochrome C domain-containing protein [Haloferula rosea]|uniref:PSD1 domain-containing protein n=1 Tax=Haloferula rosea TaxID=490093 RepID=A0A934VC11_9BACT|nr:PSD1 and planctomycete cytochrome C domain-containing protein [Haloferula rosea]MBK1827958.1 PSD1 domain-containing protein [Haloferula rosea]